MPRNQAGNLHSANQPARGFFQQLGIGVASLTFGVALSVFIYAVASGAVSGGIAWLLFGASFLLMLRFWWRYSELFIQHIPSHTFVQFLFDFLVSFSGILAVLFVSSIQTWAFVGAGSMAASFIRCCLSWKEAENNNIRQKLRRTALSSLVMLILMAVIYVLAPSVPHLYLAAAVLAAIVIFIMYASRKP